MTAEVLKVSGDDAYDLIYPAHLSMLSEINQDTMRRTMHNSSWVWVGCEDGKIMGTWGLIAPTLLSDRAYLWLFTTEHMQGHTFAFVRYSQRAVEEMLKEYPLIVGHVLFDNTKARRWIKWLGAEFLPPQGQFLPFEIRAK